MSCKKWELKPFRSGACLSEVRGLRIGPWIARGVSWFVLWPCGWGAFLGVMGRWFHVWGASRGLCQSPTAKQSRPSQKTANKVHAALILWSVVHITFQQSARVEPRAQSVILTVSVGSHVGDVRSKSCAMALHLETTSDKGAMATFGCLDHKQRPSARL